MPKEKTEEQKERARAKTRAWRAAHPERVQAWKNANPEYHKEYNKAWRDANPERVRAQNRAWHNAHPEARSRYAKAWRDSNPGRNISTSEQKLKYARTQLERLGPGRLARQAQCDARRAGHPWAAGEVEVAAQLLKTERTCECCAWPFYVGTRRRVIDHCHVTGRIRGLLCAPCNHMLGHAQESARVLRCGLAYLEPTITHL